jgi:hypothetical protein
VKERKGPLGRTVDIVAGTVADTVRRRRQARVPRALVYDAEGHPRVVPAGSEAQDRLVELAESLVTLAADEGERPDVGDDPLEE